MQSQFVIGADVGSTTVKCVVIDPGTKSILWSGYERHEARQADTLYRQLAAIETTFSADVKSSFRIFMTGSGATNLLASLGGKFVQEVNAVTLAVDVLHPDVGSVIELGGQDAKIIIYKPTQQPGSRRVIASMNDKCASGTGATIDKCIIKVGTSLDAVRELRWQSEKLHHVAAKCGVFAETDIVNLVKSALPAGEILCSLADAIVMQNLSVLTRGNTLRHRVLLLGGPNRYLPFLQDCWRQRIIEIWNDRGYEVPPELTPEQLVFVPSNAELYAAYGAALFGLQENTNVAQYRGAVQLTASATLGAAPMMQSSVGPPLVANAGERDEFITRHRVPPFVPPGPGADGEYRGFVGIDGGSTSSKAVLVNADGDVLFKHYQLSRGNPIADVKEIFEALQQFAHQRQAKLNVLGLGATGYAADVLEQALGADANVVETVAHFEAARRYFEDVDVVCDVGGQDIKVLFAEHGRIRNFRLSNQCSAGNGMLLQAMADQFGIPLRDFGEVAFSAARTPIFNYGCAVFLDTDRVTFQKEGFSAPELLAGLAAVLPKNIWQYVVQIPRLAQLGKVFVLQGGTQYNLAAVKAQHDYITQRVPGARVAVHPHCGEAGAVGAALEARRAVLSRGASSFIGVEASINLHYVTRNDASTVCHFCPNECQRTFIDTTTPSGVTSRYIAGFSCENGTVESKDALRKVAQHRKSLRSSFPNLVQYEAELAFKPFFTAEAAPALSAQTTGITLRGAWSDLANTLRGAAHRTTSQPTQTPREEVHIGMPRVLNMYSTGPLWRAYFESLGVRRDHIHYSQFTTEESWAAGGKYGSIDPCFPAKVVQAHIHELLGRPRQDEREFLFFPCITRLTSFVSGMKDATACPIVAGTPKVIRAAFTKEMDYFARAGVEYVDSAVTLTEPHLFRRQMFETWQSRLGITEAENDFAVGQGFEALRRFDEQMQERGRAVLEALEREQRVGILLLARPYHADPGLNHDLLEEFQALSYPILSIRSIPKDPAWLRRFFPDIPPDESPLAIRDVWPEAYSTNSAEKVWAAKFAARHPNLVVLDLSSFKCGNDAPTYGIVDSIVSASATPYAALHDIDANKPAGSMKIRVRTYDNTLRRHAEELRALAAKRTELERRIAERRSTLYEARREALDIQTRQDARRAALARGFDQAFAEYLEREVPVRMGRAREPERGACAVEPAETPTEHVIHWMPRIRADLPVPTLGEQSV